MIALYQSYKKEKCLNALKISIWNCGFYFNIIFYKILLANKQVFFISMFSIVQSKI